MECRILSTRGRTTHVVLGGERFPVGVDLDLARDQVDSIRAIPGVSVQEVLTEEAPKQVKAKRQAQKPDETITTSDEEGS